MRRHPAVPMGRLLTVACGALVLLARGPEAPAATAAAGPSQDREAPPEERVLERAWPIEADGSLRVDVRDADVAVGPGQDGRAEVEVWLSSNDLEWARGEFEKLGFAAQRQAPEITVTSSRELRRRTSGAWADGRWLSVRVEVRVPASFHLELRTGDGDVELGRMSAGALIDTGDGDVDVANVSGPEITIHTADGDVRAVGLHAARVEVESQDGDIHIGEVDGFVSARTSDGDVRIGTARSPEVTVQTSDGDVDLFLAEAARLVVETGDGDVVLQVPADLRADLDLEGDEVDIHGEALELEGRVQRRRARAALNGGGPRLRVRSHDGIVRIVVHG